MAPLALFGTFGAQELILILVIVLFLFGAKKIPEMARGLGEGIRGFRQSLKGDGTGDETDGAKNDKARKEPDTH